MMAITIMVVTITIIAVVVSPVITITLIGVRARVIPVPIVRPENKMDMPWVNSRRPQTLPSLPAS